MRVELPLDPADLVLDEAPDPRPLYIEVLDIENYVPARVRLTLDDPPDEDTPLPSTIESHTGSHVAGEETR